MLNKVMAIGRLGQNPVCRPTSAGQEYCRFSVATGYNFIDRDGNKVEKTEWISVIVFGRTAVNCSYYLSKGSMVYVEGALSSEQFQQPDGSKVYKMIVKASKVLFLGSKDTGETETVSDPIQNKPRYSPPQVKRHPSPLGNKLEEEPPL